MTIVIVNVRRLRNGVQGSRHGERGPNGRLEEGARAADGRGRAHVDAARNLAA